MIHFVAGLPRSGSTLLMQLLGQNPNHYVTPTSGLIDVFVNVTQNWKHNHAFQAEGLSNVRPRMETSLRGLLTHYYLDELQSGKSVFDKNRAWPTHIEDLRTVLGREPKIIMMVRDVRDVVASFEKRYQARGIDYQYHDMPMMQTLQGRVNNWLSPAGPIGSSVNRMRDALRRARNNCLVVPFSHFTNRPVDVVNDICTWIGNTPGFSYDTKNVRQITHEDDCVHGYDLHTITNPVVTPARPNAWRGVIPDDMAADIDRHFQDISRLDKAA